MADTETIDATPEAPMSIDEKIEAFRKRHAPEGGYTTTDLAKVPPCPICGALARIVDGRLSLVCDKVKHYKALQEQEKKAKIELIKAPAQTSLEIDDKRVVNARPTRLRRVDEKREWWNR